MTQPRLVGNRYELGALIGYGGMAEVHRGRDLRLGRDVAIKILRADLARDPSFLNRFRREAQAAAGLNHPAIVAVYDTGEDHVAPDAPPVPFIVMEFVEGRTLREILKSEGRLPARRAMQVVAEVCAALDYSHQNGIIHRDIKPANVMITATGAVKVMDFGIARAIADNAATATSTAQVIGTAQYLSPEQARGENVDARSDVYSTGCLFYELLTGQPPFRGDSPVAVAYQHVRENAVAPSSVNPEVPAALDSITMKALAKNPLNRYQSSGEMRIDLMRALADQPVLAEAVLTEQDKTQYIARSSAMPPLQPPLGAADFVEEHDRRRTAIVWTAVVVALLLIIGIAAAVIVRTSSHKVATVKMPSLIGQTSQAASDTLRSVGLVPGNVTTYSGECGDPPNSAAPQVVGKVCTQEYGTNSEQPKGTVVGFTIYAQGTTQVPQVQGLSYADAVAALTKLGLRYTQTPVPNAAPAGTVVGQDPPAYQTVAPNSTVTLQVSNGKVAVPSVIGQPVAAAKLALSNAGWGSVTTIIKTTNDKAQDGIVLDQNPEPASLFPQTQLITLVVGQYVLPACPPTPTAPSSSSTATGTPTASSSASASVTPTVSASPTCT
jgi:serine/threonine-protein kinase